MMTREELSAEFWLLTQGILQDSQVDAAEAKVVKRWLEEHAEAGDFSLVVAKLDKFLKDGFIDRFESRDITTAIGTVLRTLRESSK